MKRAATFLVVIAVVLGGMSVVAQNGGSKPDILVGRSKVATKYGIVAASHPLAARAGVQVLERGGNAVDAAIATNAVMGLVEPHYNGIGGDVFSLVAANVWWDVVGADDVGLRRDHHPLQAISQFADVVLPPVVPGEQGDGVGADSLWPPPQL